ncbi:rab-like protein 6 isoform X2 [Maniola jurtina]|uniref:rab-like protein 6 isoform X2 n=1 Tax=Maniola jurtina TaxID=191418 RepID=UPI001E6868D8|nr:rab-like protein 6 isoform X2 [Maniola jurtina]
MIDAQLQCQCRRLCRKSFLEAYISIRLQGGAFTEEYVPTEQIQVAPIHWAYKNTDFIVKVEVWEVVDKGRTKKKPLHGLKLENQSAPTVPEEESEIPVLDATFLDVYKNATGVILMMDITKPWTFEYVVKELSHIPADLPVVILGNHCDMQHHRQVHSHHIDQALYHARTTRTAPIRYAESSMRNGFGLRLLHKFLSVPFLRLQKSSLLEQLQRNQIDMEEIEKELDDFQSSEESQYNLFVDRLANKRRQSAEPEPRLNTDRAPSIVLGAGKPIIPPNVNPLLAQSLNPGSVKPQNIEYSQVKQTQYVSPDLIKTKPPVSMEMTPSKLPQDSIPSTPSGTNVSVSGSSGALDEFYAGTLDSSFLEDLGPIPNTNQEMNSYESDSDEDTMNPKVIVDEDDLDVDGSPPCRPTTEGLGAEVTRSKDDTLSNMFTKQAAISKDLEECSDGLSILHSDQNIHIHSDYPLWAGDSSIRRSPEGGEDPDNAKEPDTKVEKKQKKKKSKDKDKGDYSDKSDRTEKKHKHKKSKGEKRPNPQQDLLAPSVATEFNYEEYDSI